MSDSVERANIPDAPAMLKDHKKPLARRMYNVLVAAIEEARENYDVIYRYKVGKAHETEALNNAETPEARAFRQARSQHIDRVKQFKAEYEEQIAPFIKRLEERIANSDAALKEREDAARGSIHLESAVSSAENQEALDNYKAAADMVRGVITTLTKQGVDVNYTLPTSAGGKAKGEARGFTPRFDKIVVNDAELSGTKLMDLVSKLDVEREFALKCLVTQALGGNEDNWKDADPGTEFSFHIDNKGAIYNVTVTKAAPPVRSSKVETDGTVTTEAPDDDDDEEEEEN